MGAAEWITLVGLIMFWVIAAIGLWTKFKIQLTKIDLEMKTINNKIDEHIKWGQNKQLKNEDKFDNISQESKENYKDLILKIDSLIDKTTSFMIYCEKTFSK